MSRGGGRFVKWTAGSLFFTLHRFTFLETFPGYKSVDTQFDKSWFNCSGIVLLNFIVDTSLSYVSPFVCIVCATPLTFETVWNRGKGKGGRLPWNMMLLSSLFQCTQWKSFINRPGVAWAGLTVGFHQVFIGSSGGYNLVVINWQQLSHICILYSPGPVLAVLAHRMDILSQTHSKNSLIQHTSKMNLIFFYFSCWLQVSMMFQ